MMLVQLRYNTENKTDLFWRVVIDGEETLAREVFINCGVATTKDKLPDGREKFHISCVAKSVEYQGKHNRFIIN